MALADRSAVEAAQRIADAFEAASVPYAIGGALALAVVERLVAVRAELDHTFIRGLDRGHDGRG